MIVPSIRIRYPVEYQVYIEKRVASGKGETVSFLARTVNVSLSGIGIELPTHGVKALSAGDRITISFHFLAEEDRLPLEARVVWQNGVSCGLQILERDPEKLRYFTSLVDACEAYLYFRPENSKPKIVA